MYKFAQLDYAPTYYFLRVLQLTIITDMEFNYAACMHKIYFLLNKTTQIKYILILAQFSILPDVYFKIDEANKIINLSKLQNFAQNY